METDTDTSPASGIAPESMSIAALEMAHGSVELRQIDQMKTDFVSVATHQLRTPLSAIKWTLSMLLRGDVGELNADQRALITKASESTNRMINLLGSLLLSDQIEAGKIKATNATTLIPDLPQNLLIELQPVAAKKNIEIVFEHSGIDGEVVQIDPEQLRTILQNLIENSIKYSLPDSKIVLTIKRDGGSVVFSVADQGIGIPADQQKDVFTRFFRARNAVKMETDGSGLGLFIAKNMAERNLGKIWFESVENKGSTFSVALPIAQ